jgi:hypothetical protein
MVIALAAFVAVALIHFSYVDFRFRHLDGILWFWLMRPAPVAIWISRLAVAAALIASLAMPFVEQKVVVAVVIIGLVLLHIAALIVLEVSERR